MQNFIPKIVFEVLREPSWEFFFGIAGLLTTLWFIPRKQLVCSIEKVPHKDSTFIATIYNSGNTTIKTNDYERGKRGKCITILINRPDIEFTIQKIGPDKMQAEVQSQNNEITIQPLLFNRNDSLNIEFTLDSPININEIECHARIAGMKNDIKVFYSEQNEDNWDKKEKIKKLLIMLALICEFTAIGLIIWVMLKN